MSHPLDGVLREKLHLEKLPIQIPRSPRKENCHAGLVEVNALLYLLSVRETLDNHGCI